MVKNAYTGIRHRSKIGAFTPQFEAIPGEVMVKNTAGGYGYEVTPWQQLDRFLVLGTEGGTYYASEKTLTVSNAKSIEALIKQDGVRVVARVEEFSEANRVPKQDPSLFVLALAISIGNDATKRAVVETLPRVARIGTHLFTFVTYATQFRGWGRVLRDAVSNWYFVRPASALAYQAIKYQAREGWSHRDILRLSHAHSEHAIVNEVLHWMVKGWPGVGDGPHPEEALRQIWAMEKAKRATSVGEIVKLIETYNLPREVIPTQYLNERAVWEAMLPKMPMTAMIRNLATMSRNGVLVPFSDNIKTVIGALKNAEALEKAHVHPIQLLSAYRVYESGGKSGVNSFAAYRRATSGKGDGSFEPIGTIKDALESAFYASFKNVKPTGKRLLLGFDVSGSMDSGEIAGVPGLNPRDASAAMGLVTAKSEWDSVTGLANYHSVAFTDKLVPLALAPSDTFQSFSERMSRLQYGRTDCAAPIQYALDKSVGVDTFIVYTDNETYAGYGHPSEKLRKYRKETGIDAQLIVVAFTSTGFTIADPKDKGMLDVVGFDAGAPAVMSSFIRREF